MNKFQLIALSCVAVIVAIIAIRLMAFRVLNSPDGERYQKMRMQGPFVPLSAEEIADDQKRIRQRKNAE